MHELRVRRELGTHLADAVAQRDHDVEPLRRELVEVLGAVRADVDAAPLHARAPRWGAAASDGSRRSRPRPLRPTAARAAPPPSATGRCCPCTGTAPGRRRAGGRRTSSARPRTGATRERRMQRGARGCQQLPAAREVDAVVAVASVGRAPTHRHQPAVAQLAQVVRHQALRLVDELVSSATARSLPTSSRRSRHRTGWPRAAAREAAPRREASFPSSRRARYPRDPKSIK